MTTAGLEPATFWYRWAIEAKRATIALGSLNHFVIPLKICTPHAFWSIHKHTLEELYYA